MKRFSAIRGRPRNMLAFKCLMERTS